MRVGRVGNRSRGLAAGVGASRGSAREARGATLALLLLHPGLQHPRPEKSLAPPGGCGPAGSAALVSHKKKKKEEEKVGEADAKTKINRDKREEGGVAEQPFWSYGVPAGTAKEKKKKDPGVNASGGGCVWRGGGSGVKGGTGEIYYCLWQPPREPGRGAEARGGGGCGQRTTRST